MSPAAIATWRAPLALREALAAAPANWRAALQSLVARTEALGFEPRVYGSFAWQALTGLAYVSPGSDLDLAWQPRSREQVMALFSALHDWEVETGRRADGEVLLPGGAGVCWRELARGDARALVKTAAAVTLRPRQEIVAALIHGYGERAT